MAGLLVKVRGNGKSFGAAAAKAFGAKLAVEPILHVPAGAPGPGLAKTHDATWLRVSGADGGDNDWDRAHALVAEGSPFAAVGGAGIEAVEPDIEQQWLTQAPESKGKGFAAGSEAELCAFDDQDKAGGKAVGPRSAWNLQDDFSRLKLAREKVGAKQKQILIAHLDTGYDAKHMTLPAHLRRDLQANFMDGEDPEDAADKVPAGMEFMRNRGHGTGTLSLLAGNKLDGAAPGFPGFADHIGGAPLASIMPVRIADWVVRFSLGTMVRGIDHAVRKGAHVISMSMGGVGSEALADAVNLAYDRGVVMVTAAGNNVSNVPSPKSIVFPARFKRVIAACGVMADGRAYAGLGTGTMQGNFGPAEKMLTALGAYTPNVPWAQIGCPKVVDMDGAGTSAATPQIAAAAALWLAEHWDEVKKYPEPWMRVQAVRLALFSAAVKTTPRMGRQETLKKLGQGVMNAAAALKINPARAEHLQKLPPAEAAWPWLNLIFGGGVSLAPEKLSPRQRMLALELTQIAQLSPEVDEAMAGPEGDAGAITGVEQNRYLEAALDLGQPSKPLKDFLEKALARPAVPVAMPGTTEEKYGYATQTRGSEPPHRRIRVYALDPTAAKTLDTLPINETTLSVPWDDAPITEARLRPGPVGEYLEVVDIDPASGKVYDPVDLNSPMLLAQNGLPPSEGNPKFHQQMVYAVAMKTIGHFEEALGRRALWPPRYQQLADGSYIAQYVARLRIYPHALRAANAYYSPEKRALLFGYFRANSRAGDVTAPGTVVFTCLSSDIVAHEMSHALLDGLHRGYEENSNPDVAAFHEAFSDIVALFQHFTIPELVSFEIARSRANLNAATLLSGLAKQFGEGTDLGGALRDYVKPETDRLSYATTLAPHDRGSILVRAMYDAFIAIFASRSSDLLRIATGGSGILPKGAMHPDLVSRLTDEACKAARQLLRICIRALDYCPSVDITFGDYLRALVTADVDAMPEDPRGYRVAVIHAFRKRGILPRDVRTVSTEELTWNVPHDDHANPKWLTEFLHDADFGLDRRLSRRETFELGEANRWRLWSILRRYFKGIWEEGHKPDSSVDMKEQSERSFALALKGLGLKAGIARYNSDFKQRKELEPGSTTFEVRSVRPTRRAQADGTVRTDIIAVVQQRRPEPVDPQEPDGEKFWFRGGATIIIQQPRPHERGSSTAPEASYSVNGEPKAAPRKSKSKGFDGRIRYVITKNSDSARRLEQQRRTMTEGGLSPLQALYFGSARNEPFAMMHAGRRGHDHG